jgi:hypothetical protein
LQIRQTESITGTSTSTPTIVARAAPDVGPNSVMATATASSKKLLAPIRAPGDATLCGTLAARISKSGQATPSPGDLSGESAPVATGSTEVAVRIDRVVATP